MRFKLLIVMSCMLMATRVVAESTETISVTFKNFPAGSSFAKNEEHDLGGGLVIYTTLCHFTEQLRIYSSTTYNGYVISDSLPGPITRMSFKMGYEKDVLNVYGSTDKENWTLVKGVETTSTSYKDYTLDFPSEKGYTCFKLDVKGEKQIRIESMSVTYIKEDDKDDEENGEEITVSSPVFNPVSTTFTSESLEVTMTAAEGCGIYYTKDGSTPTYINAEEYNGTQGDVVTILASESPVTLKAIAVDPTTGKCSNVSSATYTNVTSMNTGSELKPYTVADVKGMTNSTNVEGKWVKGTICGTIDTYGKYDLVTSNFIDENIAIGDKNEHIAVKLTDEKITNIRKALNLKDHPYFYGKEILIKGRLSYCYSSVGVEIPDEYKITYNVPINSYGYATLYLDMPVSVPDGTTAYYCTIEDNYAKLFSVGSIIPSKTGVIIESVPNTICTLTYTTKSNTNEESISNENLLIGFLQNTTVEENGYAYYALNVKDNKLGFYIPQTAMDKTDAAAGFTAKANKSYLQVPVEQKVRMFIINREGDESSIIPITHISDGTMYDLQGRVVYSPTSGMYIRNGKKVVIKK